MRKSWVAGLVVGSALAVAAVTPAVADPPPGWGEISATLRCSDGGTYDITLTRGQGRWTPAFDSDSARVFIPIAFNGFEGSAYDAETGELLFSFSDNEVVVKHAPHRGREVLDCTFTQISMSPDDSEFGTDVRFEVSGGVTAMVTS